MFDHTTNRYGTLFETMDLGVVFQDADGRIIDANSAALQILGLTRDQIEGRTSFDPGWRAVKDDGSPFPGDEHPAMVALRTNQRVRGIVMGVFHPGLKDVRWIRIDAVPECHPGETLPYQVYTTFTDITESRRAADDARRWREVFARTELAMAVSDPATNTFVDVNERFAHERGYSVDELRGRPVFEVFPPDRRVGLEAVFGDINRVGRGVFESEHMRKDGSRFPVLVQLAAIHDAAAALVARVAYVVDTTDRKGVEQALRESEAVLRTLFDAIPESVFLMDTDGVVLAANDTFASRLGLSSPACVGRNVFDFIPAEAVPRRRAWVAEVVATRRPIVVTDERQGLWLEHHLCPICGPDGEVTRIVVFAVDTTGFRTTVRELRESEERYRQLIETTFDWVWEIDEHARYTYASDRVEQLLGYTADEILGKTPFDLMPPAEAARVGDAFRVMAASPRAFSSLENVNLHKNGSLITLESIGTPVFDQHGRFRGYRGMDRDVTARRQLEEQLRQAQKLEAIGQLAGGVAHDFNNILAGTMMHLGLLQENPKLDRAMRNALKELEAEAVRAATLTRQLLMFSRRSVLEVKVLDVVELVTNLLKMLRRLIGEDIDLRFDATTAGATVQADAGMLEQVVMNLVVNARDAMPRGGRITIGTARVTVSATTATAHPGWREGSFVCLTVADTGVGMDRATLARIFEPFFTTKPAGHGTGLGLATVHGIVAQHGGWIDVESVVGAGTTFRVYLPAHALAATQASSEAAPPLVGGRETILLVEDELAVRRMIAMALGTFGYRVVQAGNGREALRLWQAHQGAFDLIFTDMVMPEGMTGLELVERLQLVKPGLRAVISSGYSSDIVQSGAPSRAGVLYLPKPYDMGTLGRTVREWLDQ